MTRKIKLLLSSLLMICLTHAALAQTNTTDSADNSSDVPSSLVDTGAITSPLTSSVIVDCNNFLNTLAAQDFSSATTQQQNKALSAAATNPSSLLICYQNNACQQTPLSSNPNCSQYLSLWYLYSIAPQKS